MPVFNAGAELRLALISIIRQSFTDWELLLIDDGSTDGAIEANMDLMDSRIRIIRDGENKGLAARLNQAIDLAQGRFFARMDQDDISHPERFAQQIEFLLEHPEIDLLGTLCVKISEANEVIGELPGAHHHAEICARPWRGFYLPHPSWMGQMHWFRKHRYATPGPYFCEDQELLLRTYARSRFHVLQNFLLAYRVRENTSWRKKWRTRMTLLSMQFQQFIQHAWVGYAVLAIIVTSLRLLLDGVYAMRGFLRTLIPLQGPIVRMESEHIHFWKKWIATLQRESVSQ